MSDFVSWDNEIPNCFIPWFQSAATSDVISGTPFLAKMLQFNLDPSFRKWSFPAATSLTKSLDPLHHKDVAWQTKASGFLLLLSKVLYLLQADGVSVI